MQCAQVALVAVLLDGVGHAMSEHDGIFAPDDLVQRDQLFGLDERAGAVVDEDVLDVGRKGGERVDDRVLAFAPPGHEDRRGRRVGGEFHHLALVTVDDDVEIGDGAAHEGGGRVGEHRAPGERREHLVRDGTLHAGAAAGGEENGGGAGHGVCGGEGEREAE